MWGRVSVRLFSLRCYGKGHPNGDNTTYETVRTGGKSEMKVYRLFTPVLQDFGCVQRS
jgi:hypothetical protein